MTLIGSMDYPNKFIYLHADTVGVDLDTILVYKEARELRRVNEEHRKFDRMIIASGNVEKIAGVSYTAISVQLLNGCRIVPYDADQELKLIRDTFTDDGVSGVDCFDRSSLTNHVDIDVDFPEIEIRTVSTGGALTTIQDAKLMGLPEEEEIASAVWDDVDAVFLKKVITNKKSLVKTGSVWQLIIYDDDDATPILTKDLKDKDGNNISDIAVGVLAEELKTSV